jgi:hypoxanthine phosphoribosyltransferase
MSAIEGSSSNIHELDTILVTKEQIEQRVKQLGRAISDLYGNEEVTLIAVINGSFIFTADLIRQITSPTRLDSIRISSYRDDKVSNSVEIIDTIRLSLYNRHVLIIDDILDTGKTLKKVTELLLEEEPLSLRTCVLLDKKGRREIHFDADFVGFSIPDKFVVGYGLDFAERYRNLPCIGVLKAQYQNPPQWVD